MIILVIGDIVGEENLEKVIQREEMLLQWETTHI